MATSSTASDVRLVVVGAVDATIALVTGEVLSFGGLPSGVALLSVAINGVGPKLGVALCVCAMVVATSEP